MGSRNISDIILENVMYYTLGFASMKCHMRVVQELADCSLPRFSGCYINTLVVACSTDSSRDWLMSTVANMGGWLQGGGLAGDKGDV